MSYLFAAAPALPLHTAGPYVAAAYIVFVAVILVYVAIMARKQVRTERELRELREQLAVQEPETGERSAAAGRSPTQERVA
jgi:CcmD family protein